MSKEQLDSLEALRAAELFIGWYRQMAMQGEISVSNYALERRPVGWGEDYSLMKAISDAIELIEYNRATMPDP